MNDKNYGRFGQAFPAAKVQDFSKEMVCYNCQKRGHVARFAHSPVLHVKVARQLAGRPVTLGAVTAVSQLNM